VEVSYHPRFLVCLSSEQYHNIIHILLKQLTPSDLLKERRLTSRFSKGRQIISIFLIGRAHIYLFLSECSFCLVYQAQ
jgi:hypothetical protein